MFQMGSIGPMLGQAHHFLQYAPEDIEYARNRYRNEANRLYGVLDRRLGESPFVAGDDYTIADIAIWPWTRFPERQGWSAPSIPISSAGSMASPSGRRCSAASRCWPTAGAT